MFTEWNLSSGEDAYLLVTVSDEEFDLPHVIFVTSFTFNSIYLFYEEMK